MNDEVRSIVLGLVERRASMKGLGEDDNYFDLGVSSLTIVELQIAVESALGVSIPTSHLMRLSKIREWIELYGNELARTAGERARESSVRASAGERA